MLLPVRHVACILLVLAFLHLVMAVRHNLLSSLVGRVESLVRYSLRQVGNVLARLAHRLGAALVLVVLSVDWRPIKSNIAAALLVVDVAFLCVIDVVPVLGRRGFSNGSLCVRGCGTVYIRGRKMVKPNTAITVPDGIAIAPVFFSSFLD